MEKWKLPIILPMSRQKLLILPLLGKPLLCTSIFVPTSKQWLCQTPNIKIQDNYFFNNFWVYINTQQKSIRPFTYTELLYCYSHIGLNLPYLKAMSDERTTRKQRHVNCPHRLTKIAQNVQNKRTLGNDRIVAVMMYSVKGFCLALLLDSICVWNDCYIFAYFS